MKERIEYKLLSVTYKILTTSQVTYLHNLVSPVPSRHPFVIYRHTVLTRITKCTKFGQLIIRKIIKIVTTSCQILRLKCTKFNFGWGFAPDPAGGAYSAPTDPLAGFKGPTSKGREGRGRKGGQGGKGRDQEKGKGRKGEREREGRGRGDKDGKESLGGKGEGKGKG